MYLKLKNLFVRTSPNQRQKRYELHFMTSKEELLFWERCEHIYNSTAKSIKKRKNLIELSTIKTRP